MADIPFPAPMRLTARTVQGVHTEVWVQSFTDTIFIFVSQTGRVGSMISTTIDNQSLSSHGTAAGELAATTSKFLFGAGHEGSKKRELQLVYASHISQMIAHQNPAETRQVMLTISLQTPDRDLNISLSADEEEQQRKQDRNLFENVIEMVNECSVW
ncbi:proteasome assembly chaperone 3 [Entomortierella parvispora]|uniref:Proteasome assembly chaperone 3 n=1 Tax=Entomortierella parvispora TaxID=205924 RepID=A0A9P3M296_9FUNG|nr:proteasome assembly chaperone 3 [Entomortierella parvispora]